MKIVGQVIKGTVEIVDEQGKAQILHRGQTIALGDVIKGVSADALMRPFILLCHPIDE